MWSLLVGDVWSVLLFLGAFASLALTSVCIVILSPVLGASGHCVWCVAIWC